MPTRLLREQGHDITVLYANSNIAPRSEYDKRLAELVKYGNAQEFEVVEAPYEPEKWERVVAPIGEAALAANPHAGWLGARHVGGEEAPANTSADANGNAEGTNSAENAPADMATNAKDNAEGTGMAADVNNNAAVADSADMAIAGISDDGAPAPQSVAELLDDEHRRERCRACYRLRLEEAAAYAAEHGFEGLSTTLAVSPYQFTDEIADELQRAASAAGVQAVFEDFRPYYDEATRISRELGMYRQNYCGCRFSIAEGAATREFIKQQRAAQKAARAAERASEETERARKRAEKQAYADKQARKRAILKQLREQA